jgi:NAD(P)-dependent dehydrogenase (short-subunit alcohol dehydrogenase family)
MAGQLEGRVALVTGGGAGIGRATALTFAREGAKVIVSGRSVASGEETVRMIKAASGDALWVKADVSQATQVEALINTAVDAYGRVDCAFNNAGIEGVLAPTAECTEENWDRTIAVNLKGVWLCLKYEIPQMLKQGNGAIVNNASTLGLGGIPTLPAYVASKHGVVGLTKTAALEYAKMGLRINAVCPGAVRTPLYEERIFKTHPQMEDLVTALEPVGRMGTPEEIAAAVVWLCSDAASFVTGHAMAVDGGWVAQ